VRVWPCNRVAADIPVQPAQTHPGGRLLAGLKPRLLHLKSGAPANLASLEALLEGSRRGQAALSGRSRLSVSIGWPRRGDVRPRTKAPHCFEAWVMVQRPHGFPLVWGEESLAKRKWPEHEVPV
jgi:hypothetical protein